MKKLSASIVAASKAAVNKVSLVASKPLAVRFVVALFCALFVATASAADGELTGDATVDAFATKATAIKGWGLPIAGAILAAFLLYRWIGRSAKPRG